MSASATGVRSLTDTIARVQYLTGHVVLRFHSGGWLRLNSLTALVGWGTESEGQKRKFNR